jgi:acetylornithine deacetylase
METPEESYIVKIIKEISGKEAAAESFNTEGGIFNKKGCHSVVWGPGSIKQAHKPDEYIERKYAQQEIVDTYIKLIRKTCCQKRSEDNE